MKLKSIEFADDNNARRLYDKIKSYIYFWCFVFFCVSSLHVLLFTCSFRYNENKRELQFHMKIMKRILFFHLFIWFLYPSIIIALYRIDDVTTSTSVLWWIFLFFFLVQNIHTHTYKMSLFCISVVLCSHCFILLHSYYST